MEASLRVPSPLQSLQLAVLRRFLVFQLTTQPKGYTFRLQTTTFDENGGATERDIGASQHTFLC